MTESPRVHVARWSSYERLEHGVLFQAESSAGDPLQVELTLADPAVLRVRMAPAGWVRQTPVCWLERRRHLLAPR